jgi:hypothetical protein
MAEKEAEVVTQTEEQIEGAEQGTDEDRLDTLEKVHEELESGLNEGAETPPA